MNDADAEASWPDDAIEVARVLDAWGVKGWIKVQPIADDPQALFSSRRWFLKAPEEHGLRRPVALGKLPALLKITEAKHHGDLVVAQVRDVSDRAAAEALRGARIFVGRASFPTAGADEYYWVDLLGLAVLNRQGDNLGTVAGLIDTGVHSVLRVTPAAAAAEAPAKTTEAAERLIPFVSAYVDDVSLAQRRITVDWGLDY